MKIPFIKEELITRTYTGVVEIENPSYCRLEEIVKLNSQQPALVKEEIEVRVEPFFEADLDCVEGTVSTSLRGCVHATYADLKRTFGSPKHINQPDADIRVEWCLRFHDGTVATIYDWRRPNEAVTEVTEWNIGGFKFDAVLRVEEAIKLCQ
jgi:hypothetical protein